MHGRVHLYLNVLDIIYVQRILGKIEPVYPKTDDRRVGVQQPTGGGTY